VQNLRWWVEKTNSDHAGISTPVCLASLERSLTSCGGLTESAPALDPVPRFMWTKCAIGSAEYGKSDTAETKDARREDFLIDLDQKLRRRQSMHLLPRFKNWPRCSEEYDSRPPRAALARFSEERQQS